MVNKLTEVWCQITFGPWFKFNVYFRVVSVYKHLSLHILHTLSWETSHWSRWDFNVIWLSVSCLSRLFLILNSLTFCCAAHHCETMRIIFLVCAAFALSVATGETLLKQFSFSRRLYWSILCRNCQENVNISFLKGFFLTHLTTFDSRFQNVSSFSFPCRGEAWWIFSSDDRKVWEGGSCTCVGGRRPDARWRQAEQEQLSVRLA